MPDPYQSPTNPGADVFNPFGAATGVPVTPPAPTPAPTPTPTPTGGSSSSDNSYVDPAAWADAMNSLRTKIESNNKLIAAKNAAFKGMYDQKLSPEETAALTPSLQLAMQSGDRNMLDTAISAVNDQIKGYNNTIDTNLSAYTAAVNQTNSLKENIFGHVATMMENNVDPNTIANFLQGASGGMIDPSEFGFTSGVNIPAGTLAAENNNPGNLRYTGAPGETEGQGGFAAFATPEAGMQALESQIALDSSRGETVGQFINKYAPPSENDTGTYISQFCSAVGATPDTPLNACDPQKVAQFMAHKESGTTVSWTSSSGATSSSAQDWATNIEANKDTMYNVPANLRTQVNAILAKDNYLPPATERAIKASVAGYPKLIKGKAGSWLGGGTPDVYAWKDAETGEQSEAPTFEEAQQKQNDSIKAAEDFAKKILSSGQESSPGQVFSDPATGLTYTNNGDGTYAGSDGNTYTQDADGNLVIQ